MKVVRKLSSKMPSLLSSPQNMLWKSFRLVNLLKVKMFAVEKMSSLLYLQWNQSLWITNSLQPQLKLSSRYLASFFLTNLLKLQLLTNFSKMMSGKHLYLQNKLKGVSAETTHLRTFCKRQRRMSLRGFSLSQLLKGKFTNEANFFLIVSQLKRFNQCQ